MIVKDLIKILEMRFAEDSTVYVSNSADSDKESLVGSVEIHAGFSKKDEKDFETCVIKF